MGSDSQREFAGEMPTRYPEPLPDRLDYCRAVLYAHGLITISTDDEIVDEIDNLRDRVREEIEHIEDAGAD